MNHTTLTPNIPLNFQGLKYWANKIDSTANKLNISWYVNFTESYFDRLSKELQLDIIRQLKDLEQSENIPSTLRVALEMHLKERE